MVTTILMDFWGTIFENGVWSPIRQVRKILNIRLPFTLYIIQFEKEFMTGEFESLKDAFTNVCQKFNIRYSEEQLNELIGLWNKNWMLAKEYDETFEVLEDLKKDYKLIMISNSDAFSISNIITKYDLKDKFDKIYLSCEVGALKTNKGFFEKILEENGLKKEDCLVIGDSVESDIQGAKNAGIKSILIDRRERREFEPKIKNLLELRDKIKELGF